MISFSWLCSLLFLLKCIICDGVEQGLTPGKKVGVLGVQDSEYQTHFKHCVHGTFRKALKDCQTDY